MSDYLPQDLVIDILTRLPVKSLLKLRCVCKSWNALIISPAFVTAHLNRDDQSLFFLCYCRDAKGRTSLYSLPFYAEPFGEYSKLDTSIEMELHSSFFVGYCNGVFCLVQNYYCSTHTLILWNPIIRKILKTPLSGFCHPKSQSPYRVLFGFGFDSLNNDYKVVRIMDIRKYSSVDFWRYKVNLKRPIKVAVYSLNARSWRSIDISLGLFQMHSDQGKQVFIDGVVYWLVYRVVNGKKKSFALSFDLSDESFDEIMLPECLASKNPSISVLQKSLALMEGAQGCCHVWVMKEYGVEESWTKEFSIDLRIFMGWPKGFRENGDILIETGGNLISFNTQSQVIVELGKFYVSFYADGYKESLVLLKESDDKRCDQTAITFAFQEFRFASFFSSVVATHVQGYGYEATEVIRMHILLATEVIRMHSLLPDSEQQIEKAKDGSLIMANEELVQVDSAGEVVEG
ncbi:unnamed protein product [Dovyalis caffra]|uniref:F-box domain-containing protein n=1 Tax=Dovyalis caffra TaxID=77055 RepID=A0AAV1R2L7_9ROSI|nr:unnamed protein product [Dovyalis caffra]